jgi:hypothetical protein
LTKAYHWQSVVARKPPVVAQGNDIASAAILVFKSDLSKFYWTCGGHAQWSCRKGFTKAAIARPEKTYKRHQRRPASMPGIRRFDSPEQDKMRNNVEFSALTTHLMWTESVGDKQAELEHIVHSLEANPFLRGYQSWRKRCEIIEDS